MITSHQQIAEEIAQLLDSAKNKPQFFAPYLSLPLARQEWQALSAKWPAADLLSSRRHTQKELRKTIRTIRRIWALEYDGATPPTEFTWNPDQKRTVNFARFFSALPAAPSLIRQKLKQHSGEATSWHIKQYEKWLKLTQKEKQQQAENQTNTQKAKQLLYTLRAAHRD